MKWWKENYSFFCCAIFIIRFVRRWLLLLLLLLLLFFLLLALCLFTLVCIMISKTPKKNRREDWKQRLCIHALHTKKRRAFFLFRIVVVHLLNVWLLLLPSSRENVVKVWQIAWFLCVIWCMVRGLNLYVSCCYIFCFYVAFIGTEREKFGWKDSTYLHIQGICFPFIFHFHCLCSADK